MRASLLRTTKKLTRSTVKVKMTPHIWRFNPLEVGGRFSFAICATSHLGGISLRTILTRSPSLARQRGASSLRGIIFPPKQQVDANRLLSCEPRRGGADNQNQRSQVSFHSLAAHILCVASSPGSSSSSPSLCSQIARRQSVIHSTDFQCIHPLSDRRLSLIRKPTFSVRPVLQI